MSTATRLTCNALRKAYTVATGQTVTAGMPVKLASDTTIQVDVAGSDESIGVAEVSATAGKRVDVFLFGYAVVPVKIGTGGCTRGKKAKFVADGYTDAPAHDSSGGTDDAIYGVFLESGSVGDIRGLLLGLNGNRGSA